MTSRNRGFTLLETIVALAILALALMAIFDINSGAVANHAYAKKLTVATLLARSKMTDLEQKLYDEGFSSDDAEESGDFSQDGWDNFKWRAKIIAPKTDGVSPEQLIGAIFNLPIGEGGDLSGIASMFGGGAAGGKDGKGGPSQTTANPMAGAAMGMAQPMFTQMVQQITQTVREVHLTVYWKDGTQVESLDLVTHVVSLGPGSDRNGGFQPNGGNNNAIANDWSAADDPLCRTVQGVPGPNGQMMNPQTGQPLVKRTDCLAQRGGGGGPGSLMPGGLPGGNPFGIGKVGR